MLVRLLVVNVLHSAQRTVHYTMLRLLLEYCNLVKYFHLISANTFLSVCANNVSLIFIIKAHMQLDNPKEKERRCRKDRT